TDGRARAGRVWLLPLRPERGRALREDGSQRGRVRAHGRVRRGAERNQECRRGPAPAAGRRRDGAARGSRVLPVRNRHDRSGRAVAPRQRRNLLAARSERRSAVRLPYPRRVRRQGLRLGRGALDLDGGDRRGCARPDPHDRALLALRLTRAGRILGQAPVRDASGVRRPRGEARVVMALQIEVRPDAEAVAERASELVAERARETVSSHGRFTFAVSGGNTPWAMFRLLAGEALPWAQVIIFQVDERVAPDGDPDRNLTHLR